MLPLSGSDEPMKIMTVGAVSGFVACSPHMLKPEHVS
jgi:hypothetical protein